MGQPTAWETNIPRAVPTAIRKIRRLAMSIGGWVVWALVGITQVADDSHPQATNSIQ